MFLVATKVTLTITASVFSRARVVVARNGVLTITNADARPYVLTIGATPLRVPAKASRSLHLPQRGTFSNTCAKWPTLVSAVIVR
ncbi:MAG: hypothetical protein ACKOQZ_11745 [Actinomycetota bacterium]